MKKEIIIAMPDMGNDLFRKYMKSKYVKSIERAGGKVVTIELSDKAAAAKAICCRHGWGRLWPKADKRPMCRHRRMR